MDLFDNKLLPLSKRMMPKNISDFIGQSHLLGEKKPIKIMLDNNIIYSMIFFGPPSSGKTSLAELIGNKLNYNFIRTNAVTLDIEEMKKIFSDVKNFNSQGKKSLIFIDEFHRLNKPKQDAFLSGIENGEYVLIGSTTENPYFNISPALRSRVFIYELYRLSFEELEIILDNAIKKDIVLSKLNIEFESNAKKILIELTMDARKMLNILELIVLSNTNTNILITQDMIKNFIQKNIDTQYSDENGHYDTISAFIKSVRGSDVDAALYYLALMLNSGEDPLFIARRLIILAAEDIGLAYPDALNLAVSCYEALEKIGMPEGRILLSEITVLLAGLPKSNSAYLAVEYALNDIKNGNIMKIPEYLKNIGDKKSKYLYPHDYPDHYVKQNYTEKPVNYYKPENLGFEKKIKDWLEKLKLK